MSIEHLTILGKAAIVITLIIVGAISEWKDKDGEGYFWGAFLFGIFSGLL